MPTYNGDDDDNYFTGGSGSDQIYGNGGNDQLGGGLGNDTIDGGDGGDILYGNDSYGSSDADDDDVLMGGAGYDLLIGNGGNDTLRGGGDNDTLLDNAGSNSLDGGAGDDTLWAGSQDHALVTNVLLGGEGNDELHLNWSNGSMSGGIGNDRLYATSGTISLDGGAGDDWFWIGEEIGGPDGVQTITGGAGADFFAIGLTSWASQWDRITDFSAQEGDRIWLRSVDGGATSTYWPIFADLAFRGAMDPALLTIGARLPGDDYGPGIVQVWYTHKNGSTFIVVDTNGDVTLGASDLVLELNGTITVAAGSFTPGTFTKTFGTAAPETKTGSSGPNVLYGAGGDDVLSGLAGEDRLYGGGGNDILKGGDDYDRLIGGAGNDSLFGGTSDDSLDGGAGNDLLEGEAGVDYLFGGEGDDVLRGASGWDQLDGGVGNDLLDGGADDDHLEGGDGDDIIRGGAGDDHVFGGKGIDTADYSNSGAAVNVSLQQPIGDTGGAGRDWLSEIENLVGSALGDTLEGDFNDNVLSGLAGADTLTGFDGNDTLDGGAGADQMAGWAGDDVYVVDAAGDVVTEEVDAGQDTVHSMINQVLGANVENLVLLGSAVSGTGNELENELTGNAAANQLKGLGGNDVIDGGAGADVMEGGAGDDLYLVDNAADKAVELTDGGFDTVRSSVSFVLGQQIEALELVGVAALQGTGNDLRNTLTGNAAANVLDGKGGADRMIGGGGDDIYYVDDAGDQVVEAAGGGMDTVRSTVSFSIVGQYVEQLTLIGSAAINGVGNGLANSLVGNDAANRLDGGAGADIMAGGLGDDTYVVDSLADVIIEQRGAGLDTVRTAFTYTLGAQVENLVLTGQAAVSGTGNELGNALSGNGGANTLRGLGGNDILDGGAGVDVLEGGAGNDSYVVDDARDKVIELPGGGTDTIISSVSFSLGGLHVEKLVLTGSALNGSGNGLANSLTGNAGDNVLNGAGGADTMAGATGDDTYYVDEAGDRAIEAAGEGNDTVQSSVSFSLAGQHIEYLVLGGDDAIDGTGNSLANSLIGNEAANVLNGGAGADTMKGRGGDDTYVVDDAGDVVIEAAGGGVDTVKSSVSFSLAGTYAENVTLLGGNVIDATGNSLANTLTGNGSANVLSGGEGDDLLFGRGGKDSLTGGAGADWFHFDTTLGAGNVDTILDFSAADDTIQLDRSVFSAIGEGTLAEGAFVAGTAAADADDRILYDSATNKIFYDADGSGEGAALLFAQVTVGTALTNLDFEAYTIG